MDEAGIQPDNIILAPDEIGVKHKAVILVR